MKPVEVITKIVAYYSIFYAVVKLYGIIKGMWLLPNLIIIMGLLVLGVVGVMKVRQQQYQWWYAITGVVLISALRYYETDLVGYLQHLFG